MSERFCFLAEIGYPIDNSTVLVRLNDGFTKLFVGYLVGTMTAKLLNEEQQMIVLSQFRQTIATPSFVTKLMNLAVENCWTKRVSKML